MVLVATQVKRRRGTTAENDAFTGAEGEIVVDTQRHELRVHDGVTQGGFTIPTTETADFASRSLDNLSENGEARFTNKADSDLSNTPANVDYVVESQEPTAENGYTWYRKYKSGWVEQGGIYDNGSPVQTKSANITLPIAMADTNYTVIDTPSRGTVVNTSTSMMTGTHSKTTTGFSITWLGINSSDTVQFANWQVSGMAA